jgi:hypothetical protein
MRVRSLASGVFSLVLLGSVSARAGNDDELFVGNRAAMSGGAVSATVTDSSAIWYNPAGLGGAERAQIDVSGTAYTVRFYSAPRFLSTADGPSKDGAVTEFVSIPTQIAYVRRLAPALSLGVGYFVPHASNFVLREQLDVVGTGSGSQWQVAGTIADVQHTAAAALGLALSPRLRIGLSLIGGYAAATQALSLFGAVEESGATRASFTRTVIGTESRISLESGIGLQVDLTPDLSIGVSGRTPRVELYENTDVIVNMGTATLSGPMPILSAMAVHPSTHHNGPGLLRAGRAGVAIAYRYGSGWVSAEMDVQPGLQRQDLGVNRNAVVNARLGVYHPVLPSIAIGAGIFTDRTPDAIRESLLSGSGDFYGGSFGIEINNEHHLAESEPVDSLVFSAVFALRYAFSNGDFGRAVVDPGAVASSGEPFQEAHGTLRTHEFGLYVGSGLQF